MVKPPKVPQDEIDRFNKLPKERQERFEFLARYPEYLIEKKTGRIYSKVSTIFAKISNRTLVRSPKN